MYQTEALVHVRLPRTVDGNVELLRRTGLKHGSPVEIVPPRRGVSTDWYLDCRPTATARLCWTQADGRVQFRTGQALPQQPFRRPPGDDRPSRSRLSFRLGEQLMEEVRLPVPATLTTPAKEVKGMRPTGYYRLIPLRL